MNARPKIFVAVLFVLLMALATLTATGADEEGEASSIGRFA